MKNRQSKIENLSPRERKSKIGFTLIEILITVAVLGIIAAIIIPEFQGHIQQAKEAAAKESLRILREAVERYANDHNGVPPGYPLNNTSASPSTAYVSAQLVYRATNSSGQLEDIGTPGYPYGPYLPAIPNNPLNGKKTVIVIENSTDFPTVGSIGFGWIYKPATKEIRLDTDGTDSEGKSYLEY